MLFNSVTRTISSKMVTPLATFGLKVIVGVTSGEQGLTIRVPDCELSFPTASYAETAYE